MNGLLKYMSFGEFKVRFLRFFLSFAVLHILSVFEIPETPCWHADFTVTYLCHHVTCLT